jgi:hypothetical protein
MAKRYKTQRRVKPKHSKLKKIAGNRFFWVGIAACLVCIGILYGIFLTPFFQIKHIGIEGNQKVDSDNIRSFVAERMNHLFLADAAAVGEELQSAYPEIELVIVDKTFPDKVEVVVKERSGTALWCQTRSFTVEIEEKGKARSFRQCFALDRNGIIFEEKEPEGEVIVSDGGSNVNLGEQVIAPELLASILAFQRELGDPQITALSIVSEDRVNAEVSEGWEIYINPQEDMDWQATKVKLVLQEEIPPEKRPRLEYIDLRFGDQAYIKYY